MIPNMKFYVISIVAIFAALGIGIYIGFTLDAQSFVVDQREDIASKLEERFDFLKSENQNLKSQMEELESEGENNRRYIENTYESLIKDKLEGSNFILVETNDDYMYSAVGSTIMDAGGSVSGMLTLNPEYYNKDELEKFYKINKLEKDSEDIISDLTEKISRSIIDKDLWLLDRLEESKLIVKSGDFSSKIDALILAGGSLAENPDNINSVDKAFVNSFKANDIPVKGVEKENVSFSYMSQYKAFKIDTIDNVDSTIGKVSLIYSLKGYHGNFGVKEFSDELMPKIVIEEAIKEEVEAND